MLAHTMGAASAFESIASVLALKTSKIPPTINYETPDPECDLNYVPNAAVKRDIRVGLSTSLGFGGHNSSVIIKKYEEKHETM